MQSWAFRFTLAYSLKNSYQRCLNLKYLYCKVCFKSQLLNNSISVIRLSLKGAFFISFLWLSSILVLMGYWEVDPLKEWSVCLLCLWSTSSRFCHAFITHWLAPLTEWLPIVMIQLLEIRRTSSPLRLPINWQKKVLQTILMTRFWNDITNLHHHVHR